MLSLDYIDNKNMMIELAKGYLEKLQKKVNSQLERGNTLKVAERLERIIDIGYSLSRSLGAKFDRDNNVIEIDGNTYDLEAYYKWTEEDLPSLLTPPTVTFEDLDHVKITIDFTNMIVIEERYSPFSEWRKNRFSAAEYQCQSLGITVPEIDTSQSLTPIGRDL